MWVAQTNPNYNKESKRLPSLNWKTETMFRNLAGNIKVSNSETISDFYNTYIKFKSIKGQTIHAREQLAKSFVEVWAEI